MKLVTYSMISSRIFFTPPFPLTFLHTPRTSPLTSPHTQHTFPHSPHTLSHTSPHTCLHPPHLFLPSPTPPILFPISLLTSPHAPTYFLTLIPSLYHFFPNIPTRFLTPTPYLHPLLLHPNALFHTSPFNLHLPLTLPHTQTLFPTPPPTLPHKNFLLLTVQLHLSFPHIEF